MYDLVRHTYTDTVIQKKRTAKEITAFIDMIKKHCGDTVPIIFTADRGYECYNDMAHITECGHKFVLRVKDIDDQGILSGLGLPDTLQFLSADNKQCRCQAIQIEKRQKIRI